MKACVMYIIFVLCSPKLSRFQRAKGTLSVSRYSFSYPVGDAF